MTRALEPKHPSTHCLWLRYCSFTSCWIIPLCCFLRFRDYFAAILSGRVQEHTEPMPYVPLTLLFTLCKRTGTHRTNALCTPYVVVYSVQAYRNTQNQCPMYPLRCLLCASLQSAKALCVCLLLSWQFCSYVCKWKVQYVWELLLLYMCPMNHTGCVAS